MTTRKRPRPKPHPPTRPSDAEQRAANTAVLKQALGESQWDVLRDGIALTKGTSKQVIRPKR